MLKPKFSIDTKLTNLVHRPKNDLHFRTYLIEIELLLPTGSVDRSQKHDARPILRCDRNMWRFNCRVVPNHVWSELSSHGVMMLYWTKFLANIKIDRKKVARDFNYLNLVSLLVILLIGIVADGQNQKIALQDLRTEVRDQISLVRTKLEGNINANIHLVQGLISTLQTEPKMDQSRFAELTKHLFTGDSQLRNIAAAPDLVISLMYPIEGNEKAIGLDYQKNENQRDAVLHVRDSGKMVLSGPINLVQGGQGIIGRFPVFTSIKGVNSFWGIVSAVIDVDHLYKDSGLFEVDGVPVEFALLNKTTSASPDKQFFGSSAVMESIPEISEVSYPNGSWTIAAIPEGGWKVSTSEIWFDRFLIFVSGIILFLPILIVGRYTAHRRRNALELRRREDQLGNLSKRLELALDSSNVGVWEMNIQTDELVWDDRMNVLYFLPTQVDHRNYQDWENTLHPDDLERAKLDYQTALETKSQYRSDFRVVGSSGETRNIRAIGTIYEKSDGSSSIIGLNWDVTADVAMNDELKRAKLQMEERNTELLEAKSKIEHLALHDALTGIPNRRFLDNHLAEITEKDCIGNSHPALLIVDVDRFKQINDTFGHVAGDAMLVHISEILKTCVRPGDFIARIGGDEFVIVCSVDHNTTYLEDLAGSIIEQSGRPFNFNGSECRFGVSIGISHSGAVDTDIEQLLVNADLALYRAKKQGRNRFVFFTKELHIKSIHNKRIADDIQRAIENNEFIPHYQPQYDAKTHSVVGVEALARWDHPEQGILFPDTFLEVADEINVTPAIDHAILTQTLDDYEKWLTQGLQVPKASVNVSLQRLHNEKLLNSLEKLKIRPGTLSFELVESIFLDDGDELIVDNIERIKEMGIDVELDDFGTGHTSIVSLMKLRPSRLKIDRQLVVPAIVSIPSRQLLSSIIEIGRSLNIEVVAEGVETAEHAHLLREIGCDILQGYAFAKPMSAGDLEKFLMSDIKLFA